MTTPNRIERLQADFQALTRLAEKSPLFSFEAIGSPPEHYVITFHGRGLCHVPSTNEVQIQEHHTCELHLGYFYPQNEPHLQWRSCSFHPNIYPSGLLYLENCGIEWNADRAIEKVCERLWDMTRFAYYDLQKVVNFRAEKWLKEQTEFTLPIDERSLSEKILPVRSNVFFYGNDPVLSSKQIPQEIQYLNEQKDSATTSRRTPFKQTPTPPEVFYIGEDATDTRQPEGNTAPEIFYIGFDEEPSE